MKGNCLKHHYKMRHYVGNSIFSVCSSRQSVLHNAMFQKQIHLSWNSWYMASHVATWCMKYASWMILLNSESVLSKLFAPNFLRCLYETSALRTMSLPHWEFPAIFSSPNNTMIISLPIDSCHHNFPNNISQTFLYLYINLR